MNERYDVIVIGGGASGMMAAGRAAARGKKVLLLEKSPRLGSKLSITGGGRCNILNAEEDEHALLRQYGASENFLYSPFSQFGMRDAYDFFERGELPLKVEARKRAFPESEDAQDVVDFLKKYIAQHGVEVRLRTRVEEIRTADGKITEIVAGKKFYQANSYILATGGMSHPETGSTGDGFGWLTKLGHRVEEPTPTIVPVCVAESWVKTLSGVAIKNMKITFFADEKRAFSERGDVLLTHFVLSGPLILNAAGKIADILAFGAASARIDTYPGMDLGILEKRLVSVFDANKNKTLKNVFREIAPPGTGAVLLQLATGLDPEKKVHSITKEERRVLADLLKALPITITGLMGFDRAVVADGGVVLTEVDTKTFASRIIPNLFIAGDLLHIRRPSGGYSLQLCWTSGYVAGSHA